MATSDPQLDAARRAFRSHRRLAEHAMAQVGDDAFVRRPAADVNSIAVVCRHVAGNLASRWRDFLTSDGEKPDRDRDAEFADWSGSRESLMAYWADGWQVLDDTLDSLSAADLERTVTIRGEPHTVPDALARSLAHTAYHCGQITLLARLLRGGDGGWDWATIPPGGSVAHNTATWGTPASRGKTRG